MTYLSGRAEKRRKIARFSVYGILFLLVIIFWPNVKGTTYSIIEPAIIKYGEMKVGVGHISDFFSTYTTSREILTEKNKQLALEVERLENELVEKTSEEELKSLKEENGDTKGATLVMYPLMQDITKIYSSILLSKGYKDGVEVGEYVYVRGLQPVCVIEEVYTDTSLCQLLSKGGVVTDVVTKGTSSIMLSLTGRGGGTFLADVPRDTMISVGESVYLREDPSMKLGTVVDIIHNNQDTSWYVFVRGMYNPVTSSTFYLYKK